MNWKEMRNALEDYYLNTFVTHDLKNVHKLFHNGNNNF